MLVLYVLRAALLLAAMLAAGGGGRVGGPFEAPAGLASTPALGAVVLRLGFLLAPAAVAVDGLTARAALHRSWSLV